MRCKYIVGYISIFVLLAAVLGGLAALPQREAGAEGGTLNNSSITGLAVTPALNITRFDYYTISVNVSPGPTRTINNVSFVIRPQNAGVNNSNWDFFTNGSANPSPNVQFTRAANNTVGDTWSFSQLRPDNIYPEIAFIRGINSSPSNSRFWRDSYHLMHFNNSFDMGANTSFFIEIYATPKTSPPLSVDMQVFLVGSGFNISAFQVGGVFADEAWRNSSYVELAGTISQASAFHHTHSANSSHFLVPLSTNSEGKIEIGNKSIDISGDFWIILTTGHQLQNRGWDLKYHAGCNNSGTWYKGSGTNFTLQSGCPDAHVHFAREWPLEPYNGMNVSVVVGYNESGTDCIFNGDPNPFYFTELPNLPPNPSAFTAPAPGIYQGNVTISWLPAADPNNDPITYNVYLINESETEQQIAGPTPNTSFSLNTSAYADGFYNIRVAACEGGTGDSFCTSFNLLSNFDEGLCEFFRIWNGDPEDGGIGTTGNPYLICNVCDLQNMKLNLSAHYALNNSIDLTGFDWGNWSDGNGFMPVGNGSGAFTGTFDGRGYTITGLYINRSAEQHVGLFGYVNPEWAIVSNVSLASLNITGSDLVGGLAGISYGSVFNCSVSGNVSGSQSVGGLMGYNKGTVSNSSAAANVSGTYSSTGGLVGWNDAGSVTNSSATGSVNGVNNVGGLVGENQGSVSNSYAMGNTSGNNCVGGLVGKNDISMTINGTIDNSYSTGYVSGGGSIGGLVGCNTSISVNSSFWDTETSGLGTSAGGIGKNTSEMKDFSTFYNGDWDLICETTNGIADIWGLNYSGIENNSYPFLWWQGFTHNVSFTLTYSAGPNGSFIVNSPQTVGCGGSGAAVEAQPYPCYHFVNWSDSITDNPRTDSNVTGNINVTANIVANQSTLNTSSTIGGSVTTPGEGTYYYNCNQNISINATPDSCHYFVNWSGDTGTVAEANSSNTSIIMSGNYSIQANFAGYQYTLNYSAGIGGTLTGTTSQTVNCSESGTAVEAFPDGCYYFVNWSDSLTQNPRTDTNVTNNITVTANFAITQAFSGGDGSEANPYLIQNVCQLQNMSSNLSAHYALANDIDASSTSTWNSGAGFMPVGNDSPSFTGSFNGSGYTISNLFINRLTTSYIGLFGYINGGSVSNVRLVDVNISGDDYIGGLVGSNNGGSISSCSVAGNIIGTSDWGTGGLVGENNAGSVYNSSSAGNVISGLNVGGLVGWNYGTGTISYSYSTANVSGLGFDCCLGSTGGLVGVNVGSGEISRSYATGCVNGSYKVGGLVGLNRNSILNCYATGNVTGWDDMAGGLVGYNYNGGSISYTYSTGNVNGIATNKGGLVGSQSDGSTGNSFWDVNTSGQESSAGGTGKNTSEMKTLTTFTGASWDFMCETSIGSDDIWGMDQGGPDNNGYPFLSWQGLTHNVSYTLNYSAGAGGTLTGNTAQTVICNEDGTAVTAVPNACYYFVNWSDGEPNASRTDTNVNASINVTANFAVGSTFALNTSSTAGGNVSTPGEAGPYPYNCSEVVTINASADPCYYFVNWSGTGVDAGKVANANNASTTINMSNNYSVQANFAIYQYTLNTSSTAGGDVTTPGEAGPYPYNCSEPVTINASADPCYYFVNWSGTGVEAGKVSNPNNASTTINMSNNYSVQANFDKYQYTLNYSAGANGSLTGNTSQAINCSESGTAVTAIPDSCYYFVNWSDGNLSNPRQDTNVQTDVNVTANFAILQYTLNTSSTDGGNVSTPSEAGNPHPYNCNESVAITAINDSCYYFVNWSGTGVDAGKVINANNASTTINMSNNYSVQANFALSQYNLSTAVTGTGSASGAGTFNCGSYANINATETDPCWRFDHWQGSGITDVNDPTTTILIDSDKTATAVFVLRTYTLTYTAGTGGTINGTSPQTVNCSENGLAVIAAPNTNYHFLNWSDGSAANPRTDTNVNASINVTANFLPNTCNLTMANDGNGTTNPAAGIHVYNYSEVVGINAVPSACYHFLNWTGNTSALSGAVTNATNSVNMTDHVNLTANFAIDTFTVTYIAGKGGTVTGTLNQTVNCSTNGSAVTAVPDSCYSFGSWSDGITTPTHTALNVTSNLTITANFVFMCGGVGGGYFAAIPISILDGLVLAATNGNGVISQDVDVISSDGNTSIHIDAGTSALDENGNPLTHIDIYSIDTYPLPPDGRTVIAAFEFEPSGATFYPAIQITLTYDPALLPAGADESQLVIAFFNEATGQWEYISGTVNPVNNTITFSITHFTTFAIMRPTAASAATPTPSATSTPTVTPIATPNISPTPTSIATPVATPTLMPTPTAEASPTVIATATLTATPAGTAESHGEENGTDNWVWIVIAVGGGVLLALLIGAIVIRTKKQ